MKCLLDTHALLWWLTDDPKLSGRARETIADAGNRILVSAASAWEIGIKHRLGKLDQISDALSRFDELILADGFEHLPISHRHAILAASLPSPHRDPFDRMLAAQSALEEAPLISVDRVFAQFDVSVIW
jgi:PIN domain nuclease of toxin-antitoxin system